MIKVWVIRLWASAVVLSSMTLGSPSGRLEAQTAQPASQTVQAATRALLDKAHAQELRGRMDLAVQTWQEVLLSDPRNTEALGNLARAAKLDGDAALASKYLNRIRAIDPNDPNLARVESPNTQQDKKEQTALSQKTQPIQSPKQPAVQAQKASPAPSLKPQPPQSQKAQLQEATDLAGAGKYDAAMEIYRRVYGTHPPAGQAGLAYYETAAAIPGSRADAVAALRAQLEKEPSSAQNRIALGHALTFDPGTREEGREYLQSFPSDPKAAAAFRQSLLWDAANPAMAPQIRAYLATHKDPELAAALEPGAAVSSGPAVVPVPVKPTTASPKTPTPSVSQAPARQPPPKPIQPSVSAPTVAVAKTPNAVEQTPNRTPPPNTGMDGAARTRAAEMSAYQALNANHIDEAETRFKAILASEPQNAQALAGMGYVRMQQGNFAGAIGFLEQAKQNNAGDKGLASALDTARFWFIMSEGQRALTDSDLATAEKRYRSALELRPDSPEALEGLGGTLARAQQSAAAIPLFDRAVVTEPGSVDGWRGLFMAQVQSGNGAQALATEQRIPAAVQAQLMSDPLFLVSLASAYSVMGRGGDAEKALESAVKLPFPADAKGAKSDTQIQLAGLLFGSNHLDEAESLYSQVIAEDHGNIAAWQGLARVQHALGHDDQALKTVESMPSAVSAAAMREPGFELTVASIYEAEKKLDVAQDILQKAASGQTNAGRKPSVAIEMQLANIYTQRGSPQLAYPVYEQVIAEDPNRADAWAGLLSALHVTGHDSEAAEQLKGIPPAVRAELEKNAGYLQTMASVYQALGRSREASPYLNRMEQDYAAQSKAPPAEVEIQNAWLLYNGMEDAGLYGQLMDLGGRTDLTADQRKTVQAIWTNWAVRRASQAAAGGNLRRALAILNAAAKAFPDNPAAIKALAIGYAQAGQPQQAVLIYKAQNMTAASAADYEAAVSAALAANDSKDAEIWLRYGLAAYPSDPGILILGAKFEQSRGDTAKAIKYYRASLKAMPPAESGSKQAVELGFPAPTAPQSLPNADQPQDLSVLLAPEGGESSTRAPAGQGAPYLPSYKNQTPSPSVDSGASVVPPYMSNPGSGVNAAEVPDVTKPGRIEAQTAVQSATSQALGQPAPGQTSAVEPGNEVYHPYVAYIAPPPRTSTVANTGQGVTGKAVLPVQLGDATPPPVQQQTDMTDVLPTARYAPSARANQAAAAQPEVNAARAARIRKLQEDAGARTGQSQAPPEGTITATPQSVQYTQAQNGPQVSQPVSGPAGQFGGIPDTGAQQYPQPRTPPAPEGIAAPRSRPVARAPSPAPVAVNTPAVVAAPVTPPPVPSQPAATTVAPVTAPAVAPSYPLIGPAYPLAHPPTDAELRARNLPALGGAFESQAPMPMTPRQQAESQLAELEGSYSGWLGATGIGRYRSGMPGLDRLYDVEAPVEASAVIGRSARLTAVALPVFLNSGVLSSSSLNTSYVPFLGTLPANTANPPAQQFSNGIGGELQLTSKYVGLAVGYTPYQFLVRNVTARFQLSALGGHVSLFGDREAVKDTQLSYAGLRDPGVGSAGPIWGGVVATKGGARLEVGSTAAKFYVSGDGGILTGQHVLDNYVFEGTTGASFRVANWPQYGSVTLGGSLSGMHYAHNEVGLTYGQGGYFSPGSYFLAAVPVTFAGRSGTNFHYSVTGALGVQTFEQEVAPFYPLDPALQAGFVPPAGVTCTAAQKASYACGEYPLTVTTLFSYGVNAEASYRFADHWYGGGFVTSNNANNYNMVSAGFFFRYVFSAQHSTDGYPPGLFRVDGLRPLQIP